MMRSTNPSREFIVIRDVYKETTKGPKLMKKNVASKMRIFLDEVYMVEEVLGDKGRSIKGQCGISIRDKGFVVVREKFESVVQDVFGDFNKENKKVGFNV